MVYCVLFHLDILFCWYKLIRKCFCFYSHLKTYLTSRDAEACFCSFIWKWMMAGPVAKSSAAQVFCGMRVLIVDLGPIVGGENHAVPHAAHIE